MACQRVIGTLSDQEKEILKLAELEQTRYLQSIAEEKREKPLPCANCLNCGGKDSSNGNLGKNKNVQMYSSAVQGSLQNPQIQAMFGGAGDGTADSGSTVTSIQVYCHQVLVHCLRAIQCQEKAVRLLFKAWKIQQLGMKLSMMGLLQKVH
jgi:hypothetical protein